MMWSEKCNDCIFDTPGSSGGCRNYGGEGGPDCSGFKITRRADLRNKSGNVVSKSKLMCFLYLLLEDKLSAGEVENMVNAVQELDKKGYSFTNGYLANYAKDLADRLK